MVDLWLENRPVAWIRLRQGGQRSLGVFRLRNLSWKAHDLRTKKNRKKKKNADLEEKTTLDCDWSVAYVEIWPSDAIGE
jgi:hypothetical protein